MTLLLTTEDVQDLISIEDAIAVTETVVKEEAGPSHHLTTSPPHHP